MTDTQSGKVETKVTRRRLWWAIAAMVMLVVLVCGVVVSQMPEPLDRSHNPAITFITEPLHDDGRVNYFEALREMRREGVTADNNAFVDLLELFGPEQAMWMVVPTDRHRAFEELGIDPLPREAAYLPLAPSPARQIPFFNREDALWSAEEVPDLAEWYQQHNQRLDEFLQSIAKKTHYYEPMLEPTVPLMWHQQFTIGVEPKRALVRLLYDRALLRIQQGQYEAAWQDLLGIHEIRRKLTPRYPDSLQVVVDAVIIGVANEGIQHLLDRADWDAETAVRRLDEFNRKVEPFPDLIEVFEFTERMAALAVFENLQYGAWDISDLSLGSNAFNTEFWVRNPGNLQRAMKRTNQLFDSLLEALAESESADRYQALENWTDEFIRQCELTERAVTGIRRLQLPVNRRFHDRVVGELLMRYLLPGGWQLQNSIDRARANLLNVRTALVLLAYRDERGAFPDSLEALVPDYLESVPLDPFDGQPLRYRAIGEGFIVYSIGVDRIDQGGRSTDESRDVDVVIRYRVQFDDDGYPVE